MNKQKYIVYLNKVYFVGMVLFFLWLGFSLFGRMINIGRFSLFFYSSLLMGMSYSAMYFILDDRQRITTYWYCEILGFFWVVFALREIIPVVKSNLPMEMILLATFSWFLIKSLYIKFKISKNQSADEWINKHHRNRN